MMDAVDLVDNVDTVDRARRPQSPHPSSTYAEISANGALALIAVVCPLLDRQLASQAKAFEAEGGFTERLYRVRNARRGEAGLRHNRS